MIRPILLLALALSGCATPYWVEGPPGIVTGVIEVAEGALPMVCGAPVLGCYVPATGAIYIKSGMTPTQRRCTIDHEYKHGAGWRHPAGTHPTSFGIDCGDGQMVPH